MKLQHTLVCVDCEELIDADTHPSACPKCGNHILHLLSMWLQPKDKRLTITKEK